MRKAIETVEQLRDLIGEPHALIKQKIYSHLFDDAIEFIARSPLLFMATSGADGMATVSPKGDAAGFVRVLDDQRIVIPERPGNKLLHGFANILETGQVGLIFVIPGTEECLRVNGRARLFEDSALASEMAANGKDALLMIEVEVQQCFFHCAKAFKRSKAWSPEHWPERMKVSFGKQIASNASNNKLAAKAISFAVDQAVKRDYKNKL